MNMKSLTFQSLPSNAHVLTASEADRVAGGSFPLLLIRIAVGSFTAGFFGAAGKYSYHCLMESR